MSCNVTGLLTFTIFNNKLSRLRADYEFSRRATSQPIRRAQGSRSQARKVHRLPSREVLLCGKISLDIICNKVICSSIYKYCGYVREITFLVVITAIRAGKEICAACCVRCAKPRVPGYQSHMRWHLTRKNHCNNKNATHCLPSCRCRHCTKLGELSDTGTNLLVFGRK